jgi:hypothetical protein
MRAILLGYDKHFGFIELTYKAYMALWATCPFKFRIPVNDRSNPDFEFFTDKPNVELIDSPTAFKATARALLDGVDDDDWVYWCVCDRYPSELNVQSISTIYQHITSGRADSYNAIRLVNLHEQVVPHPVHIDDLTFFPKVGYMAGFWHHQFLRTKVLRVNLLHSALRENYHVSELNQRFPMIKDRPDGTISVFERTLIPEKPIMRISEPCIKGRITVNGLADLQKYGCKIPDLPLTKLQVHV